jgi:hypothetical protein
VSLPRPFALRAGGRTVLLEAVVLLALLVLVNTLALPDRPGFLDASPHPYVIATLLGAARYGFFPGVGVALLFSAVYFTQIALGVEVSSWRDFLAMRFGAPAIYALSGGALLGLVADVHLRRIQRAEERLAELESRSTALASAQAELRDVNAELASRIVGAEATLPALYRYARLLNATDEEAVYRGLVEVAKDALGADQVTLYMPRNGQLVRRFGEGPDGFPLDARTGAKLVREGGVLTLRDLPAPGPEGPPLYLAGALRQGEAGPVVGVLTVDRLDFRRYTEANLGLFRMLVDWGCVSLGQAVAVQRLPEPARAAQKQAADARSRRSAERFAQTGRIRLADVSPDERTVEDGRLPGDSGDDVFSSARAPAMESAKPTGRRHGLSAPPEAAATQILSEDDLASLDASGGDLGMAIAAEVGRAGVEGARFATLLTRLGDQLGQVRRK